MAKLAAVFSAVCHKMQEATEDAGLPGSSNPLQDISYILPDLICGLQSEKVEIAEQVVMGSQELQIEFWEGQACLPCNRRWQ